MNNLKHVRENDWEWLAPDGKRTPWGMEANTRWIVSSKIQHDLYHTGEINHIRALRQRNDE
jgi:hypothetical protein